MSEENVEIVRRVYRAWEARDWSRVPELFDADAEIDLLRNVFNPDVYRGREGLERFVSVVEDMWDDFHVLPTELIDAGGDNVVSGTRMSGKGKESGVRVEMDVFQVWTLRDSKVLRLTGGYRDRSDALEAVGLSESEAHGDAS